MMGLDQLGYEDLYAPIVPDYDRTFTPEQATELTLTSVAPLGTRYVDALRRGLEGGWVDWFPRPGKRSGAYSTTVYGLHPFQLQNFTGLYEEVSTLAHEAGHSMHSYLADAAQPYATSDYPIFIAEVASTLNENLLFHTMLERAQSDDERLFLLGSYLDNLRTTLFRQTLFAEFERKIHERGESGQPLTGEFLSNLYLELLRTYYGAETGVCAIDPLYASEWAYIPHFYYNYYVYQYATSVVAAISLAQQILDETGSDLGTTQRDAYLDMLAAGSSRYAYDMLKAAGVDLATSRPFDAAMAEMNRIMDRMEEILARRTGTAAAGAEPQAAPAGS
jgi:oligoendopeptidase F